MTISRRRTRFFLAAAIATLGACGSPNPAAVDETGMILPPAAPTDTSGFAPTTRM